MAADVSKTFDVIKNASEEEMSAVEKAVKETLVDANDAKVLEILKRVDPDTYHDYQVLAKRAAELPRVKPGDLITSELINALIDRINALELGAESILNIGPLAQGARTLVALAGPSTAGGGLWVDGERLRDANKDIANAALFDSSLDLKLTLTISETGIEAAFEQFKKLGKAGDVLMLQLSTLSKDSDTGAETRQNSTGIGIIPATGQSETALHFMNSIQAAQLPFTWALYNQDLKRFVLGGSSEDARLQAYLKAGLHVIG